MILAGKKKAKRVHGGPRWSKCSVLSSPAGVKGLEGWGLDKPGELTRDSLISTDNSSAVGLAIAAFFPVF